MKQTPRTAPLSGINILAFVAVTLLLLVILSYTIDVLVIGFMGLLLAILLNGVSHAISNRTGLPYRGALLLVIMLLVLLISGIIWWSAPTVVSQVTQLAEQLPASADYIEERFGETDALEEIIDEPPTLAEITPAREDMLSRLTGLFSTTLGMITNLILVLAIGIFLAVEPQLYMEGVISLFPVERRARIREVMEALAATLRIWLVSRGISMVIIGIFTTLGLVIIGVPFPVGLGIVAASFELIPNIGPILAAIPAVMLTLPENTDKTLYVVILYLILNVIEANVISPVVERTAVKLPPALTITMQILLGVLIGPIGVFIAPPLTAIGIVLVRMLYVEDVLHASFKEAVPR